MSEPAARSSWSTTCRRTSGCSRPSSRRAATRSSPRRSGAEALDRLAADAGRPRAARHRDARDGRLRGLPRAARRPRDGFLPVVMITASGDAGEARRDRGRRRRLRREAVRPGRAARARRARCCGSSATTTRSRRRRPSSRPGTGSSSSASTSRSTSSSGSGRLRRFLSPQLADLVVSSGDDSFLQSHRREITVVFCDLRGFTASPRRSSRRTSWRCSASTTRRSATSSTGSRARSSASPATG